MIAGMDLSIAQASPRAARDHPMTTYVVDEMDRIVGFDSGYLEFAADSGWLEAEDSMGRPLWDFVSGVEVRLILQTLFRSVRAGGPARRLPYRCDSPEVLRHMLMDLEPQPDGRVEVRSFLVSSLPRATRLSSSQGSQGGAPELVTVCAWCCRAAGKGWTPFEVEARSGEWLGGGTAPKITHGICPDCAAKF